MLWKFKKEMIATNRRQEESRERLPGRGGCGLSVEGRIEACGPRREGPSQQRTLQEQRSRTSVSRVPTGKIVGDDMGSVGWRQMT